MDNKNTIWSRRPNTSNLSLSTNQEGSTTQARDFSSLSRRNGATSSHGRTNPFAAPAPAAGLASPIGTGGSNAFALGSGGAFASFGSAKTPKTPGNPFEMAMGSVGSGSKTPSIEKSSKEASKPGGADDSATTASDSSVSAQQGGLHVLPDSWVFWTRPPISKAHGYIAYEKTLHPMAKCSTVEEFFAIYKCLKPPSRVQLMTDYHLFKSGIRPIWEDKENKEGGKWVLRLKKGVADRYWDEILFACIGGQLCDESSQVNGVVLSVRNGEDVISIWTASTEGKVRKIRDSMKSILKCPPNTRFDFKSHDESLSQRATIDEQRRERAANNNNNHHGEKRHNTNENYNNRQSQDEQKS
ncbi:putative Eukaryotic translation initiation factor 4E type 2 [Seiridium cardinale]|uniref:Eukaryotic translation initiation factor 4E type 2 n=1 Tax=Seiridium cardinale TaxID=138064 RepID=A0ABR2XK78_9PEZI